MPQIFSNNATSTLSASLAAADTAVFIQPGHGGRFPTIVAPDFAVCTLEDASGNIEIVKVTAHAAAATTMTVVRAQQGTTALDWSSGDLFELRHTALEATAWEATSSEVLAARQSQASLLVNLQRYVSTFAAMVGDIDAGGFKVENAADAVNPQDYVTLAQLMAASFDGLLPGMAGNEGRFLGNDGTVPIWSDLFPMELVTGTTVTAEPGKHYVLLNAAATAIYLPLSPAAAAMVLVSTFNGRTDNVMYRNGQNINAVADDRQLDTAWRTYWVRAINSTIGWGVL